MNAATQKQQSFIDTLIAEREVSADDLDKFRTHRVHPSFSTIAASLMIEKLRTLPKKAAPVVSAPAASIWDQVNVALEPVDTSFYGIPAGLLAAHDIDLNGNDFLFIRVRTYKGRKFVSRVYGAPVRPNYQRITNPRTLITLAEVIQTDAETFIHNWFEHSGRCGRCNAVLTDQKSRAAGLGPECRKIIGG
ncbi:hypothetical protein SEA_CECE_335 [Microbacterium phage Cece]|nr:hypothetical protein SEA_CECE_33 [Microbacterium phage Cece]UVG35341.1 hypothetical protein SEA_CECE_335 [Microbacterium phage Cece]